jgi:protein-disulfide isomerase
MKKLAVILSFGTVLLVAACQPDTKNLERKVDQIAQDQRKIMDMLAKGGGAGAGAAQPRAQRPEPDRAKTYSLSVENDPFDGPADAKITLVKAYDYACPYCEKVRGTMDDLHKKYGNDLRVVYKQLVVHPRNAMAGALAFCAAGKQGKHKEMDRLIWDKGFNARQMDMSDVTPAEGGGQAQKCWETADGCKNVVSYAQELQLDVNKFKSDMKECQGPVNADMKHLQALMVGATPAFFINGRFISGAVPIENFQAVIDEELKKANERIAQGTPAAAYYQTWVVDKGLKTVEMPK